MELLWAVGPALALVQPTSQPTASAEQRVQAAAAVKKLTGRDELELTFRSRDQEPLSDNEPLILDTYVDQQDTEYWIEPRSGTVVQMGPQSGCYSPPQPTRNAAGPSVADLREKAKEIIERQLPGFASLISTLHPLEANDRRMVYFFRWEDLSEPLSETELPPFVQVGLYANGDLASFADTLSSYRDDLPGGNSCITDLPSSWSKNKKK